MRLTDRILEAMDMTDWNHKYTTADKDPRRKDLDGEPCCEDLGYIFIFGMILYLVRGSRTDIV